MSKNFKRLLTLAICLVMVAAVVSITRTDVVAQIRAALVKNVDEPFRTPWVTRSAILPGSGCWEPLDCYNYQAFDTAVTFDLRTVPVGKRWVVQSATGGFTNGNGRATSIELRNNRNAIVFDGARWLFGGPYYSYPSFDSATFSVNLSASFGPGETPSVRVSVPSTTTLGGYFVIVFSGYLIDASN